jgi:competence protein ComEC
MNVFYARPVIPLLITGILGIYLGAEFPGRFLWAAGIALLTAGLMIGCVLRQRPVWAALASSTAPLLFFLALGYLSIQPWTAPRFPPQHIYHYVDTRRYEIEGMIDSRPLVSDGRRKFYLQARRLKHAGEIIAVTGKIRVTVVGDGPSLRHGDRVMLRSRIRSIRSFQNPGGFDYRRYMTFQNVWGTAYVRSDGIHHLKRAPRDNGISLMDNLRSRIARSIADAGGGPPAAVLKALIIGDRSAISRPLRDAFNRAGVGHLLAISGLHIGIVATVMFIFFRWLLAYLRPLLWMAWTRKGAALLALLPVCFYGAVAGFSPSTQRAVIMISVFLMTFVFEREHDLINTLALAALVILVIFPPSLFSISFQLSFTAVLAIIYGLDRLKQFRTPPDPEAQFNLFSGIKQRLAALFWVSLFAIGGTLPLVMYYFNQVSLVGIFANFIIVPLVGFIVVPLGLVAAFLTPVSAFFAQWFFTACHAVLSGVLGMIELISEIPFAALGTFTPTVFEIGCYYVLAGSLLRWALPSRRGTVDAPRSSHSAQPNAETISRRHRRWSAAARILVSKTAGGLNREGRFTSGRKLAGLIAVVVVLVLIGDCGYWYYQRFGHTDLRITVIDVGSGNAALLELPGGRTILIDGGGFSDNSAFDVGARVLAPLLWRKKIKTVDTLILSHPNSDHLNGLIYIAAHFNVRQVWSNGETRDTHGYRRFMKIIADQNIVAPRFTSMPRRRLIDGVAFDILYPQQDFMERRVYDKWRNSNNNSLVIRISFGAVSFLFPGDVMVMAERELADIAGSQLDSTVLLVPHHGSRTSSSQIFIDRVDPQVCIISCGWKNRYKFPHSEVLQRYTRHGCRIYRTDTHGAVALVTDGRELKVQPYLSENQGVGSKKF